MKHFKSKISTLALFMCMFGLMLNVHGLVDEGQVPPNRLPWSSWYLPLYENLNPNLYDPDEALDRYDQYDVGAGARIWEFNCDHCRTTDPNEAWFGHCHAWAGASIWEKQPTHSKMCGNTLFRMRDRKGLLIEAYDLNYYANDLWYNPPSPGTFWRILRDEVRGDDPKYTQGMPVIGDLYWHPDRRSSQNQVWNYPIYKFRVTTTTDHPPFSGNITIWFAEDSPASLADDYKLHSDTYTYRFNNVTLDGSGDPANSGSWQGSGPYHRPDAIWRPLPVTSYTQKAQNPKLKEGPMKIILDRPTPELWTYILF